MNPALTLLQEVAFSQALIDAGVPENVADEVTDCLEVDADGEMVLPPPSLSCWSPEAAIMLLSALAECGFFDGA